MVFNDMLFEKSTNVNNNTEQIEKNTNTKSKENKSEHRKLTSSSIGYTSTTVNNKETNSSYNNKISGASTKKIKLLNNETIKNLPSQPSVGSGYFGLGIPKSPSFHSGLDQLADDYDDDNYKILIQTAATELKQSEKLSCGGGDSGSGNIGCKFKFTNIEEIKSKLSNSSFSTISAVKKVYNSKMPALQPQEVKSSSANQSLSSNSSTISSVTSTSSSISQQQVTTLSVVNSTDSVSSNATTSMSVAASSSNTGAMGSSGTTNTISATTSSIVSTLAQHFNAATSASHLLTTASSKLGSNNKV